MSANAGAYALFIISKSGGTIYWRSLRKDAPELDTNLQLSTGSTWHSLFAISSSVSPVANPATGGRSGGIEELEAETFKLRCFQSATGVKFVLLCPPATSSDVMRDRLKQVYGLYADYVLKDPNYELDQPIRSTYFNHYVEKRLK